MIRTFHFALAATALAIVGCGQERLAGGIGVGNPPLADVSLALKAKSVSPIANAKTSAAALTNPDGTFTIGDSLGTSIILDSIIARVDGIDFTLPDSLHCADVPGLPCIDAETAVKGPFSVDLMRGISHPPIGRFKLPAGVYKKIGFELISGDSASEDTWDSLTQNIVVWGRVGTSGKRFVARLNLLEGMDFANPGGIGIRADTLNSIQLGLNVDGWFLDTDMQACVDGSPATADSAGITRLQGDGFCAGTGKRLRKNIEFSGGLDHDQDHVEQP